MAFEPSPWPHDARGLAERVSRAFLEGSDPFRRLVEQARDRAIFLLDADGRITSWSPTAQRIEGYTRDQILGRHFSIFYTPEDVDAGRPQRLLARAEREGFVADEGRRVRSDGTRFWADVVITALVDTDGAPRGFAKITRDVTERHTHDEALRRSRERYRAVFHVSNDALMILDGMRIVECNPRAGELFRVDPEDLVGLTPIDFSPEYQPGGHRSYDEGEAQLDAAQRGEVQRFEWRHVRRDGSEIDVEVRLTPFDFEDRRLVLAVVRELTERQAIERREREQHAMFHGLLEGTTDIVFVKDLQGRYIYANTAACNSATRGTGREGMDITGLSDRELFDADTAEAVRRDDAAILESGEVRTYEETIVTDRPRCMHTTKGVYRDAHGTPLGIFAITRDVTEHHQRSLDLQLKSAAIESTADSVIISDAHWRIVHVNRGFESVSGYRAAEVIGRAPTMLISDHTDRQTLIALRRAMRSGDSFHGLLVARRKDGSLFHLDLTATPIPGADGRPSHFVGVGKDLTEHVALRERLERIAYYDTLTGRPNRALIQERIERAVARSRTTGQTVATLILDIDHFRRVNASLGHRAGDELLQLFAERVESVLPASATLARYAADEFALLIPGTDSPDSLTELLDSIRAAVAAPFRIEDREITISVSMGVSVFPEDTDDADTLLSQADSAMHQAKHARPGAYEFYSERLQHRALRRLTLEEGLRNAITGDELTLHYQPKLLFGSSAVYGVEALVRWQHPEHGLVSPGEFIPLAEETGIITELGAWVLSRACTDLAAAHAGGDTPALPVAVNVSATQFDDPRLVDIVRSTIVETGIPPQWLELEMTESTFMADVEASTGRLQALRELGVRVAIDDFGTGYSSLSHLQRFPLDVLKIDRSFVGNIVDNAEDLALVAAIIGLAHQLGLEVVAEGAETGRQLELLRDLGCDGAQGFFFSRPLPGPALAEWLRDRTISRSGDQRAG